MINTGDHQVQHQSIISPGIPLVAAIWWWSFCKWYNNQKWQSSCIAPIILAWAYWQWWFSGTWWWWYWWIFESLTSMLLQPGWCLLCFPTVISCLRQHFYLASSFEQAEEKCNPSIFLKEIKLWPSSSYQRDKEVSITKAKQGRFLSSSTSFQEH